MKIYIEDFLFKKYKSYFESLEESLLKYNIQLIRNSFLINENFKSDNNIELNREDILISTKEKDLENWSKFGGTIIYAEGISEQSSFGYASSLLFSKLNSIDSFMVTNRHKTFFAGTSWNVMNGIKEFFLREMNNNLNTVIYKGDDDEYIGQIDSLSNCYDILKKIYHDYDENQFILVYRDEVLGVYQVKAFTNNQDDLTLSSAENAEQVSNKYVYKGDISIRDFKEMQAENMRFQSYYKHYNEDKEKFIEEQKRETMNLLKKYRKFDGYEIQFMILDVDNNTLRVAIYPREYDDKPLYVFDLFAEKPYETFRQVAEWESITVNYIFDSFVKNNQFLYMNMKTHYGVWSDIENYNLYDISESLDGINKYMQFCQENSITQEIIEKDIGFPFASDVVKKLEQYEAECEENNPDYEL